MPHDKDGNLLQPGDRVLIRGKIASISADENGCNCTVELDERMPFKEGPSAYPTCFGAVNSKQLEKEKS